MGRHLECIEMLNDARVASLGFFKDNICTSRIHKEKKFKIKFQVLLRFAQILPDYLECLGQVWLITFSIFLLIAYTKTTVRMHRLMCIFVISRFQTTFSHEIYCQNLKDKTSIVSLGQIIKMCYCRIHAHVHAWTVPWQNTFTALSVNYTELKL